MKARLLGSLVLGAIVAAIVVIYDGKANHAALAAATARNHTTVMSSLASGFAVITLFVALVVFVAVTVLGAGRRARQAAGRQDIPARRRSRADAWR
jgi:heme/copper-type cytochrome/quinol oxidase subunit 2